MVVGESKPIYILHSWPLKVPTMLMNTYFLLAEYDLASFVEKKLKTKDVDVTIK